MNNQQLADNFVNGKTKSHGSNMFIEGNTIYSYGYHFKIAVRYDDIILFNSNDYSSSTQRQKSHVLTAIIQAKRKYLECPDCNQTKALNWLTSQKEYFELKQSRARKADYSHEISHYQMQLLTLKHL